MYELIDRNKISNHVDTHSLAFFSLSNMLLPFLYPIRLDILGFWTEKKKDLYKDWNGHFPNCLTFNTINN